MDVCVLLRPVSGEIYVYKKSRIGIKLYFTFLGLNYVATHFHLLVDFMVVQNGTVHDLFHINFDTKLAKSLRVLS